MGLVFPCTEAGIRAATAEDGGPFTFDCDDAQRVLTQAEIRVGNDVILDGEGNLIVDADGPHDVFSVPEGVTAELNGLRVTGRLRNRGDLTLTRTIISGNVGGVRNDGGRLTLVNSTVLGDSAAVDSSGSLTLINSTVSNVHAHGTFTMTSSTVSGALNFFGQGTVTNSTLSPPGGISLGSGSSLTVINSTLRGELYFVKGCSELLLTNSIVSGPAGCDGCVSFITSNGYNIESPGDTCGFDEGKGDKFNVSADDLKLGPLQDNGGPTMTHKPGPGSAAIDHIPGDACDLTEDQRGQPRPETDGTMCDVGSVEVQPEL